MDRQKSEVVAKGSRQSEGSGHWKSADPGSKMEDERNLKDSWSSVQRRETIKRCCGICAQDVNHCVMNHMKDHRCRAWV